MAEQNGSAKKKSGDKAEVMRVAGSMPWLKPINREHHRTKIFELGNSLAVRIPAGIALHAGMEMELTVEDGVFLSYDPVEAPKPIFNIPKVAGSAKSLQYIEPESRLFDARPSAAGISKSPTMEMLGAFVEEVLLRDFDYKAALAYAQLPFKRASFDRLIAAHALSQELMIVTANEKDFADVPGLKVENWTV